MILHLTRNHWQLWQPRDHIWSNLHENGIQRHWHMMSCNSRWRNLDEGCRKVASPVTNAPRHPFRGQTADIVDCLTSMEGEIAERRVSVEVIQSNGLKSRRSSLTARGTDRRSLYSRRRWNWIVTGRSYVKYWGIMGWWLMRYTCPLCSLLWWQF